MNLTWFQRSRNKARIRNGSTQKDTPLLQECIWWIRSHLSAASSQKGLWFHFLCFCFLFKQPQGRNTKPNIPDQLTPGVTSPVRENIPLFPSTTSWHHWLYRLSYQNGDPCRMALLFCKNTELDVQFSFSGTVQAVLTTCIAWTI